MITLFLVTSTIIGVGAFVSGFCTGQLFTMKSARKSPTPEQGT